MGPSPASRTRSGGSGSTSWRQLRSRRSCRSHGTGDEVAGVLAQLPEAHGRLGLDRLVGVRPAWRGRGLGLALLHESFRRFRRTGETTVALGVDAENPTGATRLYERAGMRVLWQADVWQKELRAGG